MENPKADLARLEAWKYSGGNEGVLDRIKRQARERAEAAQRQRHKRARQRVRAAKVRGLWA